MGVTYIHEDLVQLFEHILDFTSSYHFTHFVNLTQYEYKPRFFLMTLNQEMNIKKKTLRYMMFKVLFDYYSAYKIMLV